MVHTEIYTQKNLDTGTFTHIHFLHTEFFTSKDMQRHLRFYSEKRLHNEAFAQRNLYTRKLFATKYCQLRGNSSIHTVFFTPKRAHTEIFLYWETFADRHMYTFFTHQHKRFYTEKPLHRAVLTHIFLHKNFCTKEPLRTQVSTQGNPSTHKHAHTHKWSHVFSPRNFTHKRYCSDTNVLTRRSVYQRTNSTKKNKKTITRNVVTQTNLSRVYTNLFRHIFANSEVECLVRAKTPHLNLTGEIGWPEVKNCAKVVFLRPCFWCCSTFLYWHWKSRLRKPYRQWSDIEWKTESLGLVWNSLKEKSARWFLG